MNHTLKTAILAAAISTCSLAFATPTVIFSNIAGASNQLPSYPGDTFRSPSTANATGSPFVVPFFSHDGSRWVLQTNLNDVSVTTSSAYVAGQGLSNAGAVGFAKFATQLPVGVAGSDFVNQLGNQIAIANDGTAYFRIQLAGGLSGNQEALMKFDGTTYTVVRAQGDLMPGIAGFAFLDPDSIHLAADQTTIIARYRTASTALTGANIPSAIYRGNTLLASATGNPAVPGFPGTTPVGATTALRQIQFQATRANTNGNILTQGTLTTPATNVMLLNNNVIVSQGQTLAGSGSTATISSLGLALGHGFSNAGYLLRLTLSDNGSATTPNADANRTDIIFQNGQTIARTGDAVSFDPSETWDDSRGSTTTAASTPNFTFNLSVLNNFNERLIAGWTNNANALNDQVLVYINAAGRREVVLREGAAIDLNGNSSNDDDAFVESVSNNGAAINDRGEVLLVVNLRNGAGATTGQALVGFDLPITGDVNGDGIVDGNDINEILSNFGAEDPTLDSDVNGDGIVDGNDINVVLGFFGREG